MNEKEKLKKKWEATGNLDGLHASSDINLVYNNTAAVNTNINNISSFNTTNISLNTTDNTNYYNNLIVNSNNNLIVNGSDISVGTNGTTGTNTLTIDSSPTYWNFIDIPNDKELTIDISKRSVKMFDFAGVISEYVLKKFKSIILNEKEEDVIVAERNLLPGEFSKIREHLEGEVLLEFEETPDRYGSKYILFSTTQFQNIAMPLVQRVVGTTIGNDLVTVQPLNATVGIPFHMDYYWHDNINTGINNTHVTATNNLEFID